MQIEEAELPSSSKVSITSGEEEAQTTQTTKRKSFENKREELLTRCINMLREPEKDAKINCSVCFRKVGKTGSKKQVDSREEDSRHIV